MTHLCQTKAAWAAGMAVVGVLCAACEPPGPLPARADDRVEVRAQPSFAPRPPGECAAEGGVAASPARLLTRFEYDNTVRDLLGDESRPASAFPAETSTHGFDNNARAHRANPALVAAHLEVAEGVARRAVARSGAGLLPCDPGEIGEQPCAEAFARDLARRAFRRPITNDDVAPLLSAFDAERARAGFTAGLEALIEATLLSPQFLYRLEPPPGGGEAAPLDPWALASRLSYFLWGSMPDEALFEAAASGSLASAAGVAHAARRMLRDERARAGILRFSSQWLGLDALDGATKDAATYPDYTAALRAEQREEIERFVEHVWFDAEGTLEALFTSRTAFVRPALAAFYRVQSPGHEGPAEVVLDEERAGLLTRAGLLAILANAAQSSPIRRGVFVRERVLCDVLPRPPSDLALDPPDPAPDATTRERFEALTAKPECMGCHTLIDPVGFGFERFDATGRYRHHELGVIVDDSGELVGVEPDLQGPFRGAVDLSERLGQSSQVESCFAAQMYRFAHGRLEGEADQCSLTDVRGRFSAAGGDLEELIVALVTSDAFRFTRTEAP